MRLSRFATVLAVGLTSAVTVAQSTSSTTLAVTQSGNAVTTVKEGTVVTLTATVFAGNTPVWPGQVKFCEVGAPPLRCTDVRLLRTVQLSSAGVATLNFYPTQGTHTYEAIFAGTHTYASSSATSAAVVVDPFYPTSTVITYPSNVGPGEYTLDVTVTGDGGNTAPTGTVSIVDTTNGSYVLGTATLVPGPAGTGSGGNGFATPVYTTMPQVGDGTQETNGAVAVADFNGDGKMDVAVGITGTCPNCPIPPPPPPPWGVDVLLGDGSGNLAISSRIIYGNSFSVGPSSIAVGDFNMDGKPDMAVATPGSLTVLLGNGDGTFAAPATLPSGLSAAPVFVATGDFNGDGIPDLAVVNSTNSVNILLGNGDGTFRAGATYATGANPVSVVAGDFNNDGVQDLVVVNSGDNTLTVLLGKGDGTFTAAPTPPGASSVSPMSIAAADVDGDGNLDLAVAYYGSLQHAGSVLVLLGNGDGTFRRAEEYSARNDLDSIAVGDFSGDGKPDLVVSDFAGLVWVLPNSGGGQFGGPIVPQTAGAAYAVAAADFNGDGISDLLVSCNDDGAIGAFTNVLAAQLGSTTSSLISTTVVSDFFVIGTGIQEVVASYSGDSNFAPSVSAAEGLGAIKQPTTLQVGANPSTSNYGQTVTLTATLVPGAVEGYSATGTVTFTVGNTVIGNSPVVAGVATFQTNTLPAGVDTVTATYPGDENFDGSTGSTTVTVNGSASATVLTVAPNPALVGQTVTLTAAVVGVSFGGAPSGTVTFYSGTTSLGQATLNSTGSASLSMSFAKGSYVLTAAYGGNGGVYASTSPASTLVVTGFASTTALTAGPNPAGTGQPVTLTAAVSGVGSATIATGVVTFYDGAVSLGTGTLDATGHATVTTSALALGVDSLNAVYAGDATFSGSSGGYQETVETPGFTITLSSPAVTLATYQHTTTTVTVASGGNFSDSLMLSCVNAPAYVTCLFTPNPATLTANGSSTVSFYLDTDSIVGGDGMTGPLARVQSDWGSRVSLALLLPFGLLGLLRRRRWAQAALSVVLILGIASCGSSVVTPVPSTAPGTYTIAVTAKGAATGVTHSAQLTLTVTP